MQVEGWKRITFPVSVDKVGVVFREIYPEDSSYPGDEVHCAFAVVLYTLYLH